MAAAESLKVTHDVNGRVQDVQGDVKDISSNVQEVNRSLSF